MQISVWVPFDEFEKFFAGEKASMKFQPERGNEINVICDAASVEMSTTKTGEISHKNWIKRKTGWRK